MARMAVESTTLVAWTTEQHPGLSAREQRSGVSGSQRRGQQNAVPKPRACDGGSERLTGVGVGEASGSRSAPLHERGGLLRSVGSAFPGCAVISVPLSTKPS
ncbi:hypothetical protein GUJ93_ZPchr0001g31456 [Zizania palustris]|uniref:Uncharacterized protein n=1 Tax=Zizania palustris TaxID=103762 RepID=A0A8J5RRI8_ZIZPA|nr:hypothetical protein GUJ93_ZPchr0001g31456 [Zizania palustris]